LLGFAGGTTAAAVALNRNEDDRWCQMIGGAVGGAAMAASIADIPSSVCTFVAFAWFMSELRKRSSPIQEEL